MAKNKPGIRRSRPTLGQQVVGIGFSRCVREAQVFGLLKQRIVLALFQGAVLNARAYHRLSSSHASGVRLFTDYTRGDRE
jgi:hypothetical protein